MGERKASAPPARRTQGRGTTAWWLAGAAALSVFGLFYFGVIGPAGEAAQAPAAADGERPADPRITLVTGSTAPDFSLRSTDDRTVRLSDLRASSNVLLYFQEGIMCPPCWQQMRDLQRDADKLAALNVQLVTITVDPIDQLRDNMRRERLEGMTLLADTDLSVSRTYQMLYTGMMGGTRPGHSFVLVGTDGKILWRRDFREMYVQNSQVLDPVARALAGR